MCTLNSVILASLMSLLLLYPETMWTRGSPLNLPPCCQVSLPYIMGFDIEINRQKIQTTNSHASCGHHYNYCHYYMLTLCYCMMSRATFILFLSCIHANTTQVVNILCTLVATSVILWSLKCVIMFLKFPQKKMSKSKARRNLVY